MTTTKRDLQALHYLAQRLREETMGAGEWHDNGLAVVLAKMLGHNLAITIERVVRHAADPEARTPAAIERPFVPEPVKPAPRQPAKAGSVDECQRHPGEHANPCRACAADRIAGEPAPTVIHRQKPPAEVAQRGATACRAAAGLTPEPSPAPVVVTEPAVDDAAAHPGREPQDVQQRAGESDQPTEARSNA